MAAVGGGSPPLIEVMDGVLCLPVIGAVGEERDRKMTDDLLQVAKTCVRWVVIDVTASRSFDDGAIHRLVPMIKSVKLLGTTCVVSGLGPKRARMSVASGFASSDIEMYQTLRDATAPVATGAVAAKRRAPPGARR